MGVLHARESIWFLRAFVCACVYARSMFPSGYFSKLQQEKPDLHICATVKEQGECEGFLWGKKVLFCVITVGGDGSAFAAPCMARLLLLDESFRERDRCRMFKANSHFCRASSNNSIPGEKERQFMP